MDENSIVKTWINLWSFRYRYICIKSSFGKQHGFKNEVKGLLNQILLTDVSLTTSEVKWYHPGLKIVVFTSFDFVDQMIGNHFEETTTKILSMP